MTTKRTNIRRVPFVSLIVGLLACVLAWWLFRPPTLAEVKICEVSSRSGFVTFYGPENRHPMYNGKSFLILAGPQKFPDNFEIHVRVTETNNRVDRVNDGLISFEKGHIRATNWLQKHNIHSYLPSSHPPKIESGKKYLLSYFIPTENEEIENTSLWLVWYK